MLKRMPRTVPQGPPYQSVVGSFREAFSSRQRFRTEVLAGLATSFALIPEVISFAILAGVSPAVGLFSTVVLCFVIAFTGGRPAMISGAAGATALVIAPLVASHGTDYLIVTVVLAGIIQVIFGLLGVAKLQRFITPEVMAGFVNALGIMILTAQLEHIIGADWPVWVLFAIGIAILLIFPKITAAIPAPLIVIAILTLMVVILGWRVPDVGDMGGLTGGLPEVRMPDVPWTWETFFLVLPYALGFAAVGLVESVMTGQLVDGMTMTSSNKTRECWGQGVANIAAGALAGTGGCGMIGQTMVNVEESHARTRFSSIAAGGSLLLFILSLHQVVSAIPMAALAAIMVIVSLKTISWYTVSPKGLLRLPWQHSLVMMCVFTATLATNNLAVGVVLGAAVGVALKKIAPTESGGKAA